VFQQIECRRDPVLRLVSLKQSANIRPRKSLWTGSELAQNSVGHRVTERIAKSCLLRVEGTPMTRRLKLTTAIAIGVAPRVAILRHVGIVWDSRRVLIWIAIFLF